MQMNDLRRLAGMMVIGVAIASSRSAAAGTASFGLGGGAMVGDGGATVSGGGVILPNTGAPRAFFTFILPRDYVAGTELTLVAYLHSVVPSCTFVLLPET